MHVNHGNSKTIRLLLQQIEFLQMVLDLYRMMSLRGQLHYPIPSRHSFGSLHFGLRKSIHWILWSFLDVRRNLIWHSTFGVPRSTGPQHHNRHLTGLWRFGLAGPLREERLLVLIPSPLLDGNLRTVGINGKRLPQLEDWIAINSRMLIDALARSIKDSFFFGNLQISTILKVDMLGDILVVLSDFGQLRRRSSLTVELVLLRSSSHSTSPLLLQRKVPSESFCFDIFSRVPDENTKRFLRQTEDIPNSVLML